MEDKLADSCVRNHNRRRPELRPKPASTVRATGMLAPFVVPPGSPEHRDQVVLADVRWYLDGRSGRAAYEQGHIPGAVFVELGELSCPHPSRGSADIRCPTRSASPPGCLRSGSATRTRSSPTTTPAA